MQPAMSKRKRPSEFYPAYLEPFDQGWKRELVHRKCKLGEPKKSDVYYYNRDNKKFRSLAEVEAHLTDGKLGTVNFNFRSKQLLGLGDPDKEWEREAGQTKTRVSNLKDDKSAVAKGQKKENCPTPASDGKIEDGWMARKTAPQRDSTLVDSGVAPQQQQPVTNSKEPSMFIGDDAPTAISVTEETKVFKQLYSLFGNLRISEMTRRIHNLNKLFEVAKKANDIDDVKTAFVTAVSWLKEVDAAREEMKHHPQLAESTSIEKRNVMKDILRGRLKACFNEMVKEQELSTLADRILITPQKQINEQVSTCMSRKRPTPWHVPPHAPSKQSKFGKMQEGAEPKRSLAPASLSRNFENDVVGNVATFRWTRMKPVKQTDEKTPGCMGLVNEGNDCYMNAIMQCLCHTEELKNALHNRSNEMYMSDMLNNGNELERKVVNEVAEIIKFMWKGNIKKVTPIELKKAVHEKESGEKFTSQTQQDCADFLTFILKVMHDELEEENNKSKHEEAGQTIIRDIFYSEGESVVTCCKCQKQGTKSCLVYSVIPCDMTQRNIQECFERSIFQDKVQFKCSHCHIRCPKEEKFDQDCVEGIQTGRKRFNFTTYPTTLMLQLKRFDVSMQKIHRPVNFDESLTIDDCIHYSLFAICIHRGMELNAGHYIAYCKVSDSWYEFNDHITIEVGKDIGKIVKKEEVYVLFYKREMDE